MLCRNDHFSYPGQKVQMDVKIVPGYCVVNGEKYYQFTAKDECTRWAYQKMYTEHSSVSAKDFLKRLVKAAPFLIRMFQIDNGVGFPNALPVIKSRHKTLFEEALIEMGIAYHRIRISTPRHNGKVERPHGPMNSASTNTYACTAWQTAAGRWCSTRERQTITS